MREVLLHDTMSGKVVPLAPREPGRVGIYACGPTVYDRIHVGNARPFVVFSQLKRFLVHEGYDARLVINITDVNDKIYAAASARGVPSAELARTMAAGYREDTDGLGLGRPDSEPLATETITEIVDLISDLIERGHAYETGGDVYYAVASYADYGALSHRRVEDLDQGEEADARGLKRDAADFALWKATKEGEDTAWDAPWGGRGRPGWHIECSAMAEAELGLDFEIHGGGTDLVFPHHENEAAQTAAARGAPLARIWMHNGMLRSTDEKMSKSVGNVFALHEALLRFGRHALLTFFSEGHYRQPIAFSAERLEAAGAHARRIREAGRRLVPGASPAEWAPLRERFFVALARDFNTPEALAVVDQWVREANRRTEPAGDADLREMLDVLGLADLLDDEARPAPAGVLALARARENARSGRDWVEADRLRDAIAAEGWQVRDGAGGPELVPVD